MNINSRNICIIYLFLYFSLLVGFYFGEDSGAGYLADYLFHKDKVLPFFDENFIKSFLNYDRLGYEEGALTATSHSPIYVIFFLFLQKYHLTKVLLD